MMMLLLLLALCMAVIAWRNLAIATAIVLFLLPTYQLRFSVVGIPMTVLEILLLTVIAVWLIHRFVQHVGRPLAQLPWRWTMLLFAMSGVIAVFVAPDRVQALGYLKAYLLEPMVFFVVLWDVTRTERDARRLVAAFGAATVILALVALEQFAGFLPSPEPWISESPRRVASLFEYPNALGLFLAPLVGLFAAFAFLPGAAERGMRRWFPWGAAACGVLGLILCLSRGGIIAVGVVLAVLAFSSPYRRWIFGVLGGLLVVLILLPTTRGMATRVVSGTDVSTDVRYVLWQGTAKLLLDRPIVGAGLGGFPQLYDKYRLAQHTELLLYPHNIVFNFWVELGLAGLLLFVWLLIDAIRRGFRLLANPLSPFGRQLVFGVLAALLVITVHGVVDVPYFKNDLAVQFWALLALLPVAGRFRSTGQEG